MYTSSKGKLDGAPTVIKFKPKPAGYSYIFQPYCIIKEIKTNRKAHLLQRNYFRNLENNTLKLTFRNYPAIHTNYIISHCTNLQYNHNI